MSGNEIMALKHLPLIFANESNEEFNLLTTDLKVKILF